jgi:hypothetical protein
LWSAHELVKESPSRMNIKRNEQVKNYGLQMIPNPSHQSYNLVCVLSHSERAPPL